MSRGSPSPSHSYTPLALCRLNILHTCHNSLQESLSSNSLPTSDSWNISVDGIARIIPLAESPQQLHSRIFRRALIYVNIANVSVISALRTFDLFGFPPPRNPPLPDTNFV